MTYTPPPADFTTPGLTRIAHVWREFLNELATIHAEQAPLECVGGDHDRYNRATFKTPRGWQIQVFIDAGSWDYIEDAVTPDGISLLGEMGGPEYLEGAFGSLYNPDEAEQRQVWGLRV